MVITSVSRVDGLCGNAERTEDSDVANVTLKDNKDYDYPALLNAVLPPDIRVVACQRVPDHFDARFHCLYRVYKYIFPAMGLDLDAMRTASQYFVGEHDFRNFCKLDAERVKSFRRKILWITFRPRHDTQGFWEVELAGLSFLWHQVRCMMAILIMIGQGLEPVDTVPKLLDIAKTPCKPMYALASEEGLILYDCIFEGLYFPKTPDQSRYVETYRAEHLRQQRLTEVYRTLSLKNELHDVQSTLRIPTSSQKHKPLFLRPTAPSWDERLARVKSPLSQKEVIDDDSEDAMQSD